MHRIPTRSHSDPDPAPTLPATLAGTPVLALLLALLLAAPFQPAHAQQDFSDVEITAEKVADGVWMLQGAGGNMGVSAGEDGVFLIDDQFAPLTEKIRTALAEIHDGPVRFVLNTHWHGDHTGGNENFGQAGALIVAHDNVRERMSTDQFLEALNREVPASPEVALPVVTFNDTVSFHINGGTLRAFHVPPAHTDGDSVVVFEDANVWHLGDLFFNGNYPFVDLGSGGSVDGLIAAVNRVLASIDGDTKLIPGHGPLGDREDLTTYRDMLETVRSRVAALHRQGKSLEEVIAAEPTADLDEEWNGFIEGPQIVTFVYNSLEGDG